MKRTKLLESVPVGVNAHVVIRRVENHPDANVTHVVRGKSAWGKARIRRDGGGRIGYLCFTHPTEIMAALQNWYTPAT